MSQSAARALQRYGQITRLARHWLGGVFRPPPPSGGLAITPKPLHDIWHTLSCINLHQLCNFCYNRLYFFFIENDVCVTSLRHFLGRNMINVNNSPKNEYLDKLQINRTRYVKQQTLQYGYLGFQNFDCLTPKYLIFLQNSKYFVFHNICYRNLSLLRTCQILSLGNGPKITKTAYTNF